MAKIMPGVRVEVIPQTNPNDTRGETWLWLQLQALQLMVCRRKAGSTACHVHKGDDLSKHPERLFVALGRIEFTFFNRSTGDKKKYIAESGESISIDPEIIHKTKVREDAIILESRPTILNPAKADTYPAEIPS